MTDTEDRAAAPQRVNTEYGPLFVEPWLLQLWNKYGWPEDHVLQRMAEAQHEEAKP